MCRLNNTHICMSQKVYVPLITMLLSLLILKPFQKQCPSTFTWENKLSPNTQISEAHFVYRPSAFVAPSCSVDGQERSGPTEEGGTSQPTPFQTLVWMPHAFISAYMIRATWNYKMVRHTEKKRRKEK